MGIKLQVSDRRRYQLLMDHLSWERAKLGGKVQEWIERYKFGWERAYLDGEGATLGGKVQVWVGRDKFGWERLYLDGEGARFGLKVQVWMGRDKSGWDKAYLDREGARLVGKVQVWMGRASLPFQGFRSLVCFRLSLIRHHSLQFRGWQESWLRSVITRDPPVSITNNPGRVVFILYTLYV